MRAKEYLLNISKIDKLIENKIAEMEHWKAVAAGTTAYSEGDRVQSTSNKEKMADAVVRYLDMEAEVNAEIDRLIDTKREVISTIEQLRADEYDVLHKYYVQGLTIYETADSCKKSCSWARQTKGRALKNLQKILDGSEEK